MIRHAFQMTLGDLLFISFMLHFFSHVKEMSYVIEKLYLGDIDDAMRSFDLKQQKGVTHIITIDR